MSKRIPKTIISFEHNYYLDEDVFKMVNKLEQENKQLKEDKKKAREYINKKWTGGFNEHLGHRVEELDIDELLEILGDKENE